MTDRIDPAAYRIAAEALAYPDKMALERISALREALSRRLPPDADGLADALRGLDILWENGACEGPDHLEETYTSAFDLQPLCTLGCGYHVFGESYKRGRLLAGLQASLDRHGIEGVPAWLPDELPVLLRLLPALTASGPDDAEEAHELLVVCVFPALEKMTAALQSSGNPWRAVIDGIRVLLEADHPAALAAAGSLECEVFLP